MAEDLDLKKKPAPEGRGSRPNGEARSGGAALNEIERLEECKKQKDEYLAGWQRARADFLNYKKEEMERITEFLKYGMEDLILKVLPILDNFDAAEKSLQNKNDERLKGFLQIKKQLHDFLKNYGVEEIKTAGQKFDANWHEVVEGAEPFDAAQGQESGVILEEVQKGYKINGRLLRPARVKVSK